MVNTSAKPAPPKFSKRVFVPAYHLGSHLISGFSSVYSNSIPDSFGASCDHFCSFLPDTSYSFHYSDIQHGSQIVPISTDWTTNPPAMFVSTDSRIYSSADDGASWQMSNSGLPIRGHPNQLAFVQESNGTRWLYAATWGRSMFRAQIT